MEYRRILPLFAIIALIFAGCNEQHVEADAGGAGNDPETKKVVVRTKAFELSTIKRSIDYTATLEAFEEVNLAPASPGRINRIYVEEGDRVNKGQKLFLMDQTQLHQAEIQLGNLKTDLQRLATLLETGDIPRQQYDQMKTQVEVTESNVEFLKENTVIYAPFNGIITGKYFENGEMYSGAPNTTAGKAAVLTIMQLNPLKAIVNISERYIPVIKEGMTASVTADVYSDREFTGKVSLVHPVVNPMTRSFEVEITLPNTERDLKPGMFVRVSVFLGEEEAYVVPSNVVLQQEGTNNRYVFINRNGVAIKQNVTLGKRFDEKVEIISDEISDGEMLVIDGQAKLTNGDKIQVVN